jgi:exodeoxyribonuclease-1
LRARPELVRRLVRAFTRDVFEAVPSDADAALYDDLINDRDQMRALDLRGIVASGERGPDPATLFDDARLRELAWRFRARNAPQALDAGEHDAWQAFVRARLAGEPGEVIAGTGHGRERSGVSLARFAEGLRVARAEDGDTALLLEWDAYAAALAQRHGLAWPPALPVPAGAASIDEGGA